VDERGQRHRWTLDLTNLSWQNLQAAENQFVGSQTACWNQLASLWANLSCNRNRFSILVH